jgi:hypothetical protein
MIVWHSVGLVVTRYHAPLPHDEGQRGAQVRNMYRYQAAVYPMAQKHIGRVWVFVQPFDVLGYVDGCKVLGI